MLLNKLEIQLLHTAGDPRILLGMTEKHDMPKFGHRGGLLFLLQLNFNPKITFNNQNRSQQRWGSTLQKQICEIPTVYLQGWVGGKF